MTGHIYRYVILVQHVRLFRGAMGAEFLFMDDNARPHRENIVDECLLNRRISPVWIGSILTGLESNRACVGYAWPTNCSPSPPLPPVYRNFGGHCLMSGEIFPKIRLIICTQHA
ncbi:uncharacterized protein TNCV_3009411 [Trichonephila clavipes]|nr:uncharacterized protein TNCV_3009411 [Trichonephila clavipes]